MKYEKWYGIYGVWVELIYWCGLSM